MKEGSAHQSDGASAEHPARDESRAEMQCADLLHYAIVDDPSFL